MQESGQTPETIAVARIEEASLNATVVPEQQLYHGWLVRWARSSAKRARSISILSPTSAPLDERLEHVGRLYARHELPLIFRFTNACPDPGLEPALDARGFKAYGNTLVMEVPMRAAAEAAERQGQGSLRLHAADVQTFAAEVGRFKGSSPEYIAEHASRLAGVAVPKQALLAYDGPDCVGAALGVFDGGLMGIFDVISDASRRRQGIATQLLQAQLREGIKQGARQAYLQVEVGNQAARALYARYGFTEHHQYWYRSLTGAQQ